MSVGFKPPVYGYNCLLSSFNCFCKAFCFSVFSDNLHLFTISLANEKPLTVAYSFIMFSKHSNWHSFVTWTSHCSTILLHNDFARGEVWTSSTTLSTGNDESLPVFVCFLKDSSAISAMLTNQEFGAHCPPLEREEIYSFSSVGTFIESNNCISWFLCEFAFFYIMLG